MSESPEKQGNAENVEGDQVVVNEAESTPQPSEDNEAQESDSNEGGE